LVASSAFAQLSATPANTPIKLTKNETLTVSTSALTNFAAGGLVMAGNAADSDVQSVTITSTWNLADNRTTGVDVCVLSSVLTGTIAVPDVVPVTAIYAGPTATPSTAMGSATSQCATSGAVLIGNHPTATKAARKNSAGLTDTAYLQVQGQPDIAVDTYNGTLTVYAYVQ
ncbi:MAG TPA: hypothetical protein VN622_12760, partial [Clostridia bacterium]|nr:hypothetical protein [Clostridia bacterium]